MSVQDLGASSVFRRPLRNCNLVCRITYIAYLPSFDTFFRHSRPRLREDRLRRESIVKLEKP